MRKNSFLSIGIFFITLGIFLGTKPCCADDVLLAVPETIQEHSQWCWDASSKAVLSYYGTIESQCDIANWLLGETECCDEPETFSWTHSCNVPHYLFGIVSILSNFGSITGSETVALSEGTFKSEIEARRPFVMGWSWSGGGGHALVGHGYQDDGVYMDYMDPWPGNGYTTSLFTWVVSEPEHDWFGTVQLTTDPPNKEPICDANGPYVQECQGTTTQVSLDGSASSDPDPFDTLTYLWDTMGCQGGGFDDSSSATPTLTMDFFECPSLCLLKLTVEDDHGLPSECFASVSVKDTLPPYLTNFPSDTTIECDQSTDPSNTGGYATFGDSCDPAPIVSYTDSEAPGTCLSDKTITRTWTATDDCGNSTTATQIITVEDTTSPVISCNAPNSITPPDAPISFTATATDNCDPDPFVEITAYDCFFLTKNDKRINKTESCVVEVVGNQIAILDSGGVGDQIIWTVESTDSCGNFSSSECAVEVVNPAK